MKKNLPLLIVLSLLCTYALLTFHIPELPKKANLSAVADRTPFTDFSQGIGLLIGAGLFTTLVLSQTKNRDEVKQFSSRVWIIGVLSILSITTASVVILNPTGAFTWNIDRVSYLNTRLVKPHHYINQLNSTPDIIFLGTSVSFHIPASEYAQKFSLTGFNFSTIGGTIVDYSTLTNLILSRATPDKKPAVLVIELLSPSLSPSHIDVKYYQQYPIEYAASYMPFDFAVETISAHLDKVFMLSTFSQVIYVESFNLSKRQGQRPAPIVDQGDEKMPTPTPATVLDQGNEEMSPPIEQQDETAYKTQLAEYGRGQLDPLLRCNELDARGKDIISKMAVLGGQQHVSIVFYRSPVNDDFYKLMKKKPEFYKTCGEKLNRFMRQLQSENPNVFYLDLSRYTPISSGGQTFYRDSHHRTFAGTELLLEALTPTIQKAIEYARSR